MNSECMYGIPSYLRWDLSSMFVSVSRPKQHDAWLNLSL